MNSTTVVSAYPVGVRIGVTVGTIIVVFCTPHILYWIFTRRSMTRKASILGVKPFHQMPSPKGWWPFLGHSHLIKNSLHATYEEWRLRHGNIFSCQMGGVDTVVLSSPQLVAEAFEKLAFCGKPPLSVTTEIMANKGIIHSQNKLWREQRIFAQQCLKDLGCLTIRSIEPNLLESKIEAQVAGLLRKIEEVGNVPHNYMSDIRTTVLNIVCQVLFGKVFSSEEDKELIDQQMALQEEGPALVSISQWTNYFPFLKYIPYLNRGYVRLCANKEKHHSFLSDVVQEHENEFNRSYNERYTECFNRTGDRAAAESAANAYLQEPSQHFIEAYLKKMKAMEMSGESHYFTRSQLLHCLGDLFGAGTGTIISNVAFGFLYLSNQEAVQMNAYRQLQEVVGTSKPMPTFENIDDLPYIKAIVAEVLRMASIVPNGTPHGATNMATLGGYLIPKNTMIISFFWGMHHNAEYFPNPEQFNPDRFIKSVESEGRVKYEEPAEFIPFSIGGRNCVGQAFAKMILNLTFAALLHRYTVSYPGGTPDFGPLQEAFILSPRPHDLLITLRPTPPEDLPPPLPENLLLPLPEDLLCPPQEGPLIPPPVELPLPPPEILAIPPAEYLD